MKSLRSFHAFCLRRRRLLLDTWRVVVFVELFVVDEDEDANEPTCAVRDYRFEPRCTFLRERNYYTTHYIQTKTVNWLNIRSNSRSRMKISKDKPIVVERVVIMCTYFCYLLERNCLDCRNLKNSPYMNNYDYIVSYSEK